MALRSETQKELIGDLLPLLGCKSPNKKNMHIEIKNTDAGPRLTNETLFIMGIRKRKLAQCLNLESDPFF